MADNQITPFQLTDQFTMDNFNQRINETNTALQNKVSGPITALRTHDEVDNAKSIGFYTFYGVDNGTYWNIFGQIGGTIFVMPLRMGYEQFFFPQNNDFVARRLWKDGSTDWEPWEVFNPPMELGKEYRTTERYNDKPVYVKRIMLDALAIGTESQSARTDIDGGRFTSVCETLVRHEMFVYPASGGGMFRLPFIQNDGKLKAIGSMNQSNVGAGDTWLYGSIYTFADLSKYKAMVTCWYTKTTD